jgi:ribosome-associated toxin RatA of RatAB toxin-antitoxin module
MKPLLIFLLIMSHSPAFSQVQDDAASVEVSVRRMQQGQQTFFAIHASGFARRSQKKAWQVLTDYDRQHEFVPNLLSSKLLERNGAEAMIEQKGRVGFFFMTRTIHLLVRVTEHPCSALDIVLVAGDMQHYVTHWELVPSTQNGASGTRISYSGRLEPDFFVPPLLGAAILRADVKRMLEATIAEIDKTP